MAFCSSAMAAGEFPCATKTCARLIAALGKFGSIFKTASNSAAAGVSFF